MMSWPAVPQLIAALVLALIMSVSHYLDEYPKPHEHSSVSISEMQAEVVNLELTSTGEQA